MKKILTLFLWVSTLTNVCAQEPFWKTELKGKTSWMMTTPVGSLIVSTSKALLCISPADQKILWEFETKSDVSKETFTMIPGSTLITFETVSGLKTGTNIVDFVSGKTIYSSKESDVTIVNKTPLLEIGGLLLEIKLEKKIYLTFLDVNTGAERWRVEMPGRKAFLGMGQVYLAPPVSDRDGNILFADEKVLRRFDAKDGKLLWLKENEKPIKRLSFSDDGAIVYQGAGQKISALNLADGADLWKDPLKISREFEAFIPADEKSMYVATTYDLTRIDKQTGKSMWEKPVSFAVPFTNLHFTDQGLVIFGSDKSAGLFLHIDQNGNKLWKRAVQLSAPVVDYKILEKGILFATAEEANMLDLATGDDSIWKKRIRLKQPPVTYVDEHLMLLYSDEKLYRVNLSTLVYDKVAEEIKFKGSDEDVTKIERVDNRYLLSSSQNMWLLSPEGKVEYQVYYKPASLGTGAKILGRVAQVATTMNSLEAQQTGPGSYTIQRSKTGDEIVEGIGGLIANRKKSIATATALYIMTRVEEGEGKAIGMVKVDKKTGKETGKIVIKSLDPVYELDNATGQLFVASNEKLSTNSGFSAFRFAD